MSSDKIFLGLKVRPGCKRFIPDSRPFHISGVAIDKGKGAKLYIKTKAKKFLAATLSQAIPQALLDLNFGNGDHIEFSTEGEAPVSVLGYFLEIETNDKDRTSTAKNVFRDVNKQNTNGNNAKIDAEEFEESDEDDEERAPFPWR